MENASKALLMAGGMLMTMIIIGMFLLMYNNLTVFFSEDSQANREAQIVKFNEEYESYNRDDENNLVRGTEMLSLLAKVQHYNAYKSDYEGNLVGYDPMKIMIRGIDVGTTGVKYAQGDITYISTSYEQSENSDAYANITKVKTSDKYAQNGSLLSNPNGAKEKLELIGGSKKNNGQNEITEGNLETLAASLGLLSDAHNLIYPIKNRYETYELMTLGKTLSLMQNIFHPTVSGYSGNNDFNKLTIENKDSSGIYALRKFFDSNYNNIMSATKQYYQYKQFKKSYFKCTNTQYSKSTGRIIELDFEYVKIGD